jgi:hypothetical protein
MKPERLWNGRVPTEPSASEILGIEVVPPTVRRTYWIVFLPLAVLERIERDPEFDRGVMRLLGIPEEAEVRPCILVDPPPDENEGEAVVGQ